MRCRSAWVGSSFGFAKRLRSGLPLCALLGSWAVQAGMPEPNSRLSTSCEGKPVQVTFGLPVDYALPRNGDLKTRDSAPLCVSLAQGNPYELLSWLESGSVRAAVLPEFAVTVLRADDPAKFANDYVEYEVSPFTLLQLAERTLRLVDSKGRPVNEQALAQRFAEIAETAHLDSDRPDSHRPDTTIFLPHHLSVAVRELFQRATLWADHRQLSLEARERFMQRVVRAIRFQSSRLNSGSLNFVEFENPGAAAAEEITVVTRDRLLVRRQLLANVQRQTGRNFLDSPAARPISESFLFGSREIDETRMGEAVAQFRSANYRRHVEGSVPRRYFRFTVPELWEAFAARDAQEALEGGEVRGLALVLTGGGVKAAYQTRLVDALYASKNSDPRLHNGTGESTQPSSQRVEYVIGTSGGALLGMFVGALNDALVTGRDWPGLTSLLWRPGGGELKSWNVFPLLDMLRYFSVIVCFWVLWVVATVALRWQGHRWLSHAGSGPSQSAAHEVRAKDSHIVRWKSESWAWVSLLGIAPIVVVYICNRQGLEHVPPIAGIYYTLMALIAWHADVGLKPKRPLQWSELRLPKTFAVLVVVGVACIAIPASGAWVVERCEATPWQVNLCFIGFLLLAFALFAFFAHQRDHFDREPLKDGLNMLGGIAAMVCASYAVLAIGVLLDRAAFLELTGAFWIWLLPAMLVCSLALVTLGRIAPGAAPQTVPQRAVAYMFGEHNSRAFWTGHRRYTRFVVIATLSWCWWNAWVAPGLYGNCPANEYFQATYKAFAEVATGRTSPDFPLTTPYVVTATSLEKGQERYFLFVRDADRAALDDRAWFNIASDGRWITVRDYQGKDLRAAAFASGSPFPVFSSHQVELSTLGIREHLIDGGFAHNKPLDAARVLGASKVLVLNSSPLEESAANGECAAAVWLKLGELACNLPKLLPYLWSRSQVEDSLSSANMLVASIYPVGDEQAWPLLTDFRGDVVERMIKAAEQDFDARIGTVESWGAPRLSDAYLVQIRVATLERAKQ